MFNIFKPTVDSNTLVFLCAKTIADAIHYQNGELAKKKYIESTDSASALEAIGNEMFDFFLQKNFLKDSFSSRYKKINDFEFSLIRVATLRASVSLKDYILEVIECYEKCAGNTQQGIVEISGVHTPYLDVNSSNFFSVKMLFKGHFTS